MAIERTMCIYCKGIVKEKIDLENGYHQKCKEEFETFNTININKLSANIILKITNMDAGILGEVKLINLKMHDLQSIEKELISLNLTDKILNKYSQIKSIYEYIATMMDPNNILSSPGMGYDKTSFKKLIIELQDFIKENTLSNDSFFVQLLQKSQEFLEENQYYFMN